MAQRDELNQRWKHEQEKARKFEKLNREMKEEKKRILAEYTRFRNRVDDEDATIDNAEDGSGRGMEDEEKKEMLSDTMETAKSKRQRIKEESLREMEEIDRKAMRNSKAGLTVSILHILITLLLMIAAYQYGRWTLSGDMDGSDSNDAVAERQDL